MELNARDRIIVQNLRRRLISQKRDVNENELQDVVFNAVLPEIADRGDIMIGIALIDLSGHTVLAETPSNLINVGHALKLCQLLTQQSCYQFRNAEYGGRVLIGYTQNDWDWIVAKTSPEALLIVESLIDHIWCGFYDY